MVEVATVLSAELRISPNIESFRASRQDGDPVWTVEIQVNGHKNPNLDTYFRNIAWMSRDHLGVEHCLFSGFIPGARYIERQPGNRSIYRPVTEQYYLGLQHCLKDYLSNLDPDTEDLEDPYSIIDMNVTGSIGIATKINPTTGWGSHTIPKRQFVFRTDQKKLEMLNDIEDHCVGIHDVRWNSSGLRKFYYISIGDINTEFTLTPITVTPTDPTLVGSVEYDGLADAAYNYVRISGYLAYHALPFKNGNRNTILEGVTISGASSSSSATVIDVILSSGSWAAGTAAGIVILDKDLKKTNPSPPPTNIDAEFIVGEVLLQNGTARAGVSAVHYPYQEKIDWYDAIQSTSQVTNKQQPAIEYVEEYEQDLNTEIALTNRRDEIYTYLTATKAWATIKFNRRADIAMYQPLALSGFAKVPDGTYRVIGIEYWEHGPTLEVTCTIMLDSLWKAQRKLMKRFRPTPSGELEKKIKAELSKFTSEEMAILQSITDGGAGVVQTTKGAIVRGQVS